MTILDLGRHVINAVTCAMLLLALFLIGSPSADTQESLATIDRYSELYCRYRNPQTGDEETGWVLGLKSCTDGDAKLQVAFHSCKTKKIISVPRGNLAQSANCAGVPYTPGDFAAVINAKVVAIKGDDVIIAYGTTSGDKQVSLKGYNLEGLKPELNSHIVFFSTDLAKKGNPEFLAKGFEKFRFDAGRGGAIKEPRSIVGVVTGK